MSVNLDVTKSILNFPQKIFMFLTVKIVMKTFLFNVNSKAKSGFHKHKYGSNNTKCMLYLSIFCNHTLYNCPISNQISGK